MATDELDIAKRKSLGKRIDAARSSRGLSLTQLAKKAGCVEKTVRNLIQGQKTRGKTLFEVCKALSIDVDDTRTPDISDDAHGGYTRHSFAEYIGDFFSYRRSFSFPENFLRSAFVIRWNEKNNVLEFQEHQRYETSENGKIVDHSQDGEIYISNTIGLLHFVTNEKGAIRLITVSKFRLENDSDLTMRGIVLTQARWPLHFQPSSAPIIFEKIQEEASLADIKKRVGPIRPVDPEYNRIYKILEEVEREVVTFALTPSAKAI